MPSSILSADKLRIVKEAERCVASGKRGSLEALLRREGIYSSLLSSWRQKLGSHGATGLGAEKPGRKPKLTEAERRNAELTIAVFADASHEPTHAARQVNAAEWTSKVGALQDIRHPLRALEGAEYGHVVLLMKRAVATVPK